MLSQRLRRSPSIKTSLFQHVVFAGSLLCVYVSYLLSLLILLYFMAAFVSRRLPVHINVNTALPADLLSTKTCLWYKN